MDLTSKFPPSSPLSLSNENLQPPNWSVEACNLGAEVPGVYNPFSPDFNSSGRGYKNEDLIVWMRSAGASGIQPLLRDALLTSPLC